ncbi:MAG: DUF4105 domain-containing protein [Planctomycetota bacterium]
MDTQAAEPKGSPAEIEASTTMPRPPGKWRWWAGAARRAGAVVVLLAAAMCLGIMAGGGRWWPIFLAWGLTAGLLVWGWRTAWPGRLALGAAVFVAAWLSVRRPSHDHDFRVDISVLPALSIEGDTVHVTNLRNFERHADGTFTPRWEDRTYTLSKLRGVDMIVEPFAMTELVAHTMLSFDFGDEGRLVLSIEARMQPGEKYGPVAGALRQFELGYFFMDERDALSVRGTKLGQTLYAYPIRAKPEHVRAVFRRVVAEANEILSRPRWYHIIFDNCTTVWVRAVQHVRGEPFRLQRDIVLNGRIARGLHGVGVIDTDLPFEQAREKFRIDEAVRKHFDDPDLSRAVRAGRDAS